MKAYDHLGWGRENVKSINVTSTSSGREKGLPAIWSWKEQEGQNLVCRRKKKHIEQNPSGIQGKALFIYG